MKIRAFFLLALLTTFYNLQAQVIVTTLPDTITYWDKTNKIGLDINQIAFVNWSVGGNNSISALAKGDFSRNYSKKNVNWDNELILKYGLNSQEGQKLQKTDDQIQLNSTFGYRRDTISNWYFSAKFTFNTQFANGYAYPNTEDEISGPFSPAYIFLGVGAEYIRKDKGLDVYMSPLTDKTTIVTNNRLANQGAFGVEPAVYDEDGNMIREGRNSKTELGILVTNKLKREIFKNITLDHRLNLYTDYLKDFGNIDVDWQLSLDMTVNQYVKANIGAHLIYDNDIKSTEEVDDVVITKGPKIQLKQVLGMGLSYTF